VLKRKKKKGRNQRPPKRRIPLPKTRTIEDGKKVAFLGGFKGGGYALKGNTRTCGRITPSIVGEKTQFQNGMLSGGT